MDLVIGSKTFNLVDGPDVDEKKHTSILQNILIELEQQKLRTVPVEILIRLIEYLESKDVDAIIKSQSNSDLIEQEKEFIILIRTFVVIKAMQIPWLINDLLNDKNSHPFTRLNHETNMRRLNELIINTPKFNNLNTSVIHLAWMIVRSWQLPCYPDQEESKREVTKLMISACKERVFNYLDKQLKSHCIKRYAQNKFYDVIFLTARNLVSSLLKLYDICDMKENVSVDIELLINTILTCKTIPLEDFSKNLLNESCSLLLNNYLNQRRPPRLKLAASLASMNTLLDRGILDSRNIVQQLSISRLLPYMLGLMKKKIDIALGRDTNSSTIGDLIVSEECIRGSYELCIAFLNFIRICVENDYEPEPLVASIVYILNEIYPNHHLWIYKNNIDMQTILHLCTDIFCKILARLTKENQDSCDDLIFVCITSLSQGQAYQRLIDIIVSNKATIKDTVNQLDPITEKDLKKSSHLNMIRQSVIILTKLLMFAKVAASNEPILLKNVERALDNIRPSLVHHLFEYVYQRYDPRMSCLAVTLIRRIAKKFSMSLMSSLGSEADKVCEFFLSQLEKNDEDTSLNISILDLLSTCVKHQPGLIELFFNARKTDNDQILPSVKILIEMLKKGTDIQIDAYRLLQTYLLKFLLTLWQKHHSAIHQFDKCEKFWRSIYNPISKYLETAPQKNSSESQETYTEKQKYSLWLSERLTSYSLMTLAREIHYADARQTDPKMSSELVAIFDEITSSKLLTKFMDILKARHYYVSADNQTDIVFNKLLTSWRDFLVTCLKHKTVIIDEDSRLSILISMLNITIQELHLCENLVKDRSALMTETLLILTVNWTPNNSYSESLFKSFHDLIYLTNSCKDYLPFASILSIQASFNHYIINQKQFIKNTTATSNLIPPILDMLFFSFRLYEKKVSGLARIESRLCFLSVSSLKYLSELSRDQASVWSHCLKLDTIMQFLTFLYNERIDSEVLWVLMDLLISFLTIPQVADLMHKSSMINDLNMLSVSSYEKKADGYNDDPSDDQNKSFFSQLIRINAFMLLTIGREHLNSVSWFILQDMAEGERFRKLASCVRKMYTNN